ncbi:MAG: hypothetical protein ACRCWF_02675 [Beijerinckiaceae bacterium]
MALTDLQKAVLKVLSANRSETSYMAGGAVLNRDWPRMSDDFDIFHDTDEEIAGIADIDIAALQKAGFRTTTDIKIYGLVEATISDRQDSTILQWMSETRRRFLPLVRDEEWGARLHQADLAVNKVLAAASRSKARDFVDLLAIDSFYCTLAPLALAAAGKPPHMSPLRILDEIARRLNGLTTDELLSIRNLPDDWSPVFIRETLLKKIETALEDVELADLKAMGCLALDPMGRPVLFRQNVENTGIVLRRATEEPDAIPQFKNGPSQFLG